MSEARSVAHPAPRDRGSGGREGGSEVPAGSGCGYDESASGVASRSTMGAVDRARRVPVRSIT